MMKLRSLIPDLLLRRQKQKPVVAEIKSFDHFSGLEHKFNAVEAQTENMRRVVTHSNGLSTAIMQGLSNLKLVAKFMDREELNHCAFLVVDTNGRILSSQYNTSRIFGIDSENLLNNPLVRYVAPRFQKYYQSQLEKVSTSVKGELFDQVIEVVYIRADGKEVYCEERTKIVESSTGLVYQKLLKDISDLRLNVSAESSSKALSPDNLDSLLIKANLTTDLTVESVECNLDTFDSDLLMNYRVNKSPLFTMNNKFWRRIRTMLRTHAILKNIIVKSRYRSEVIYLSCDCEPRYQSDQLVGYECTLKSIQQDVATSSNIRHDVLFAISDISNDLINSSVTTMLPEIIDRIRSATRSNHVTLSKYTNAYHLNLPRLVKYETAAVDDVVELELSERELLKDGKLLVRTNLEFSTTNSSSLISNNVSLVVFIPIVINGEVWGTVNLFYNQDYPSIFTLKYLETLSSVLGSSILREQKGSELKVLNMAFESLFVSSPLPMIFHMNGMILSSNMKARELLDCGSVEGDDITSLFPKYSPSAYIQELPRDKSVLVVTSDLTYENETYSQVVLTDLTEIHNRDKYIKALTAATSKVDDVIIIANREFKVIYANPASASVLSRELMNTQLRDLELFRDKFDELVMELNSNQSVTKHVEWNGTPVELHIITMQNQQDEPIFYIIIGKVKESV